ncbi:hypothetical protein [Sphingomicrobium nitratireducens]|uniref:hypothetical protein n=1 Tax=Sphingomicrobium nitratireducens TaxID=2964666 RepID=UPI00223EDB55|nr:hypothetical protein [Sphingomicrobium nitratireducens]
MTREEFRHCKPADLRAMAADTDDPVIRDALTSLAEFVEQEELSKRGKIERWRDLH